MSRLSRVTEEASSRRSDLPTITPSPPPTASHCRGAPKPAFLCIARPFGGTLVYFP